MLIIQIVHIIEKEVPLELSHVASATFVLIESTKSLFTALCVSSMYFPELWKRRVELAFRVGWRHTTRFCMVLAVKCINQKLHSV